MKQQYEQIVSFRLLHSEIGNYRGTFVSLMRKDGIVFVSFTRR